MELEPGVLLLLCVYILFVCFLDVFLALDTVPPLCRDGCCKQVESR